MPPRGPHVVSRGPNRAAREASATFAPAPRIELVEAELPNGGWMLFGEPACCFREDAHGRRRP